MIALLSDTANPESALAAKLGDEILKRDGRVAYISSTPQTEPRQWFQNTYAEYARINSRITLSYFDLSDTYSDEILTTVLQYGTIHLSGGNTFDFVCRLRERSFGCLITTHLAQGGLVVGVSAGAIALTPNLWTAEAAGDIRSMEESEEIRGFGCVPFAFLPHFQEQSDIEHIREAAHTTDTDTYLCPDDSGVVVENGMVECFGDIVKVSHKDTY